MCENGYVLEAPFPTIKEEEEDHDVVSYEITDMRIKCFHFSSVKSKILVWDILEALSSNIFSFLAYKMSYVKFLGNNKEADMDPDFKELRAW